MTIQEDINNINVTYDKNDNRLVKCFCGKICKKSLVPHMKKDHPKKWRQWQRDFVRLKNKGWSYKRIMWKYRAIFSWAVIYRETHKLVQEGKVYLKTQSKKTILKWDPKLALEKTTVWDFKNRGKWAVHDPDYRGNWPPQIPRNLILKFTKEKEIVLDPFVGGGTTVIEAYLLKRKSIGIDINHQAIQFTNDKIREMEVKSKAYNILSQDCKPIIRKGDAKKKLREIQKSIEYGADSIDLICTHPPYMNSIIYSNDKDDLSNISDITTYLRKMSEIAKELFIMLKKGGICSILIGDIRKKSKIIPLGFKVMKQFLDQRFTLKELIIKIQNQDSSTRFYASRDLPHYLIQHEYLLIFEK